MSDPTPTLPWHNIDTVLLDMDGTLLDLNYDNTVWNELVPVAYAQQLDLPVAQARAQLLDHMRTIFGTLNFYSFDYWQQRIGLDIVAIHAQAMHLIAYRPGAERFLTWLDQSRRTSIIATNAHRAGLVLKDDAAQITNRVSRVISAHDFGAPKEQVGFWRALQQAAPFDPATTLFIDDNEAVLNAARDYGIAHLRTITTPDSQRPPRARLNYPTFDHFDELGYAEACQE